MQVEFAKVEEKLMASQNEDILLALEEIKKKREEKEYKDAIGAIKTARNKRIAHFEPGFRSTLIYKQMKLVIDTIKRFYEIRQLVLYNLGKTKINVAAAYDHRNVIEALCLQEEIKIFKDNFNNNNE